MTIQQTSPGFDAGSRMNRYLKDLFSKLFFSSVRILEIEDLGADSHVGPVLRKFVASCTLIVQDARATWERERLQLPHSELSLEKLPLQELLDLCEIRFDEESRHPVAIRRELESLGRTAKELQLMLPAISKASFTQSSSLSTTLTPERELLSSSEGKGVLLVVDDDEGNREVLSRRLVRAGYEVMLAQNGIQALQMLGLNSFDLVLLDVMMPEMDGTSVLAKIKQSDEFAGIPVIMISAVDEIDVIVQCIQSGADDYLLKPFNQILLRARINALLGKKKAEDDQKQYRLYLESLLAENLRQKDKLDRLLLNILPATVAEELTGTGSVKPMYFEDVTIVFADIVGFTQSTEELPADELVEALHHHFTNCDRIVADYGLEKLKTIGDCYMFAGGIPLRSPSHPVDCVLAAVQMLAAMEDFRAEKNIDWRLRIGINTGPVIAGVVGIHKFSFDIWGESVNYASRVEACGTEGGITLSSNTLTRVKDFFTFTRREKVKVKHGREVDLFRLSGLSSRLHDKPNTTSLDAFRSRYATYFRKELLTYPDSLFTSAATSEDLDGDM
jgi:adenylate cyclase